MDIHLQFFHPRGKGVRAVHLDPYRQWRGEGALTLQPIHEQSTWPEKALTQVGRQMQELESGKKKVSAKAGLEEYLLICVHSTHSQQPAKSPSMDEQTDKIQSTHKME